jgi:hypothetical protein
MTSTATRLFSDNNGIEMRERLPFAGYTACGAWGHCLRGMGAVRRG